MPISVYLYTRFQYAGEVNSPQVSRKDFYADQGYSRKCASFIHLYGFYIVYECHSYIRLDYILLDVGCAAYVQFYSSFGRSPGAIQ